MKHSEVRFCVIEYRKMFAGWKKFDIHSKAIEGVNQQTIVGALMTLVTSVVVLLLLFSEFNNFYKIDVVSRMVVDQTAGLESIKLDFDISFHELKCDRFDFVQEVTRGTIHVHEKIDVIKEAIGDKGRGCRVKGDLLTDKAGGNFRFGVTPMGAPMMDGTPMVDFDLSHTLNNLAFLPTKGKLATDKFPDIQPNFVQPFIAVPVGTSIFQYAVHIVPTQYKTLFGELSFINQYSVTEKMVDMNELARSEVMSGLSLRDFHGLIVTYDFNSVRLPHPLFVVVCLQSLTLTCPLHRLCYTWKSAENELLILLRIYLVL